MWPARLVPSARRLHQVNRAMQVAIVVVFLVGLWRTNPGVVVNALLALGVTALPAVLKRDLRLTLPPGLTVWLTAAVLLHAVGMLGPYGTVWWWDHLTHTLSAVVVASVGYATVRAVDIHSDAIHLPPRFMAVFLLLVTLAFGVFWEVLEFGARGLAEATGHGPVLFQYGLEDTLLDLVFDAVGAVVVALFGTPALTDMVAQLVGRLREPTD